MMARMDSFDRSTFPKSGQIQVIFGPMFSGKTTELLRRIKRYEIAKYTCMVIKYSKDNRYDQDGISTHDKQVLKATSTQVLGDVKAATNNCDVIGIDEGQFFPDCVSFAEEMADNGKIVIVAALDGTFQRKGFGCILNLVPLAENVVKLKAVCMLCYEEASYTKRTGTETAVEVIGGADKYMAVCRYCHKEPNKPSHQRQSKENVRPVETPTSQDATTISKGHAKRLFSSAVMDKLYGVFFR